ncbi:hypothetical protein ACH42_04405 [Endozoicomonas sp. (ex Bugula neritina AB1)]|nr:hypothetical protein ACH42_04405 [Endozoicomonas sp. (ex Bugula neritina AB1)]
MLQLMRDKAKSWVTFIVVGIIAFMMAITGLETLAPNPNNPEVASVNGEKITRAELAQSVDQQRRAMIQQMGDQLDPALLDDTVMNETVLNTLIERQLLIQDAVDSKMDIGASALDQMIVSMPQFQQDGRFNQDRFQMMVRSYGLTPLQFKENLRQNALLLQLNAGIANTEFVTIQEMQRLNALQGQTRDLSWAVLPVADMRAAIQPTDDEIQVYYDANSDSFMTSEQVIIDYIELNKDDLAKSIDVNENDVVAEFESRLEQVKAQTAGLAKVSAILIEAGNKRTEDEAVARAEEAIASIQNGADFATIAKEYSDDPVTGDKGGDLGFVQPGFLGEAFDEAVATLPVGQVSAPIESKYGIQVIKVVSREATKLPTLDELRPAIEKSLKQNEMDDLYLQQTRQLADISFEAADLAQPAEQFDLTVKTSGPFGREGGMGIASDARVASAAFSDDVLDLGANSELIELTPEQAVVVRVKEHKKPELMPLEEVKSRIVSTLKNDKAEQQLKAKAEDLIAELKSGDDRQTIASENKLTWTESEKAGRVQPGVPRQLLQKAFTMPHPGQGTAYDTTILPNGDLALIGLSAIYPGEQKDGDERRLQALAQFLGSNNGHTLFNEYLQGLRETADVAIKLKAE